jgi:hypothetical protein
MRDRQRFFQAHGNRAGLGYDSPGEKGHAHDPTEQQPPFLGIGTGSGTELELLTPSSAPGKNEDVISSIVSDSPTAADFNIYDLAFEAEVDRIRRTNSGDVRQAGGTMYHTKHLDSKDQFKSDENWTVSLIAVLEPPPQCPLPRHEKAVFEALIRRHSNLNFCSTEATDFSYSGPPDHTQTLPRPRRPCAVPSSPTSWPRR